MIQLTDVCKSYYRGSRNEIEVLKNINLSLPDKGLIALCGKSGSGNNTGGNHWRGCGLRIGGRIRAWDPATRADTAVMISRYLKAVGKDH